MNTTFGPNDVHDFLSLLIGASGTFYVDKDSIIRETGSDDPVGVKVNKGKDGNKCIVLYKENMPITEHAVLNPFTEPIGYYPEKDWFFAWMSAMPGCLIRGTISDMIDLALHEEKDTNFKVADILAPFIDRIDKNAKEDIESIKASAFAFVYYGRDKQTAQLISRLWDKEFETEMKSRIRKSSLNLFRDMTKYLLGVERPEELVYKATLVGCPKFDAVVHVTVDALNRLAEKVEKIHDIDMHVPAINEHMKHIEAYHKALQWLASSTASPMKAVEKKTPPTTASELQTAPWQVAAVGGGASAIGSLNNLHAAGTVSDPNDNSDGVGNIGTLKPVIPTFKIPTPNPVTVGGSTVAPVVPAGMYGSMTPYGSVPAGMVPGGFMGGGYGGFGGYTGIPQF